MLDVVRAKNEVDLAKLYFADLGKQHNDCMHAYL